MPTSVPLFTGLSPADWADVPDHLVRLLAAWLLALPVAWDREKSERSAGLRTFPLVAIATCGFVIATEKMMAGSGDAHSRMLQGVIMGIGFIGSGAILKMHGMVHGTATAASIWRRRLPAVRCWTGAEPCGILDLALHASVQDRPGRGYGWNKAGA